MCRSEIQYWSIDLNQGISSPSLLEILRGSISLLVGLLAEFTFLWLWGWDFCFLVGCQLRLFPVSKDHLHPLAYCLFALSKPAMTDCVSHFHALNLVSFFHLIFDLLPWSSIFLDLYDTYLQVPGIRAWTCFRDHSSVPSILSRLSSSIWTTVLPRSFSPCPLSSHVYSAWCIILLLLQRRVYVFLYALCGCMCLHVFGVALILNISLLLPDMSCRSRLATLNEKLTALERRIEYIEARVSMMGKGYPRENERFHLILRKLRAETGVEELSTLPGFRCVWLLIFSAIFHSLPMIWNKLIFFFFFLRLP